MTYTIAQDEKYAGNDHWDWSVWLEGPEDELDKVRMVTWILHPTFTPSRVAIRDRSRGFRLDAGGWGTFLLHAELRRKGTSNPLMLSHMLKLSSPDAARSRPKDCPVDSAQGKPPRVFLSFSSEDSEPAKLFQQVAEQRGLEVTHANDLPADVPMEAALRKAIRESDAVVSFTSGSYLSPWVAKESNFARLEGTPVFSVSTDPAAATGFAVSEPAVAYADNTSSGLQAEVMAVLDHLKTHEG